jgi:hypothetical protein
MLRLLLILAVGLLFTACGSGLPQTIPVSGHVTFDGKPPPAAGSILFLPVEAAEGFPLRPATGAFDAAGQFKAKTFEPGDGLMPGKYAMSIECWDTPPNMTGNPGKSHVPKKYQSPQTSGFNLDITKDMRRQVVNLDIVTR